MKNDAKRAAALKMLEATGMWRSNYAPPLFQIMWRMGADVPPPHFVGFAAITLLMGGFFGVLWGLFMWFVLWSGSGASIGLAVFASSFAGLAFGLCMAAYYSYGRRKHKLPRWNELNAAV
jgi:Family of unknown function (DUF6404)